MREKPEACGMCGAEAEERRRCPRCGCFEWAIEHRGHWRREVVVCDCPAPHSALGRRMEQARARQQERESTGDPKRLPGRPGKDHPVTTPEMARKAAEGLVRGLPPTAALREAGFPPSTVNAGRRGINRMIRAELSKLGRKYIDIGRDLSPEDQENMVRGRLVENVIIGTDKGVMSAKQLGADKRVAMWQAETAANLIVLQAPPQVAKLDHKVELLPPSEYAEKEDEPGE